MTVPNPALAQQIAAATDRETLFPLRTEAPVAVAERLLALGFYQVPELVAGRVVRFWLKPGESLRDFWKPSPDLVLVPPGAFLMGSREGEGIEDEWPQHHVTIPNAILVGKFPVTFAEWDAAVAAGGVSNRLNDCAWGRGRRPVINVSWYDAKDYLKCLSDQSGQTYRLLSEAEWEYVCRAGTTSPYSFGNMITEGQARFSEGELGSAGKTLEVGSFPPNAFGLHDLHGNVWEWCEDTWHSNYRDKPESLKAAGAAWIEKGDQTRVLRGGSWCDTKRGVRSACRNYELFADLFSPVVGFRPARTVSNELLFEPWELEVSGRDR